MSEPAPDVDRQTLERVELALPEWAGELAVLERNLKFDGKQLAHWLAYSHGRILLVSVVNGHSDASVLRAMDGLSFAQNQPEMLQASLGEIEDDEAQVQIVLVALEGYSKLQLERLGTLPAERIELLRRRELSTSRGTHTRMEAVECTEGGRSGPPVTLPEWSLEPEFRTFLARIAPDRLQLALTVVERMRRMDPQFGWQPEGTGLACLFDGERLARLNWEAGHMQLTLDDDRPVLPIRDIASLEGALEAVLDRYLDLLSGGRSRRSHASGGDAGGFDASATENRAQFQFDAKPWAAPYREPTTPGESPEVRRSPGIPSPESQGYGDEFREPDRRPERTLGHRGSGTAPPAEDSGREVARTGQADVEPQPLPVEPPAMDPGTLARSGGSPDGPDSGARVHGRDLEADLDDLDEEDLDDVRIQPLPPGPLLTAEEIDAFLE